MKILIVGAGALGGYFGARLLAAGRDVSFLVRPGRRQQLQSTGLVVRSRFGDLSIAAPPTVLKEEISQTYDLVIVGCKAFDLESTMGSLAPAVGPGTAILPLLNGMRHLQVLAGRFGEKSVLGGLCLISASLAEDGTVLHHNDLHALAFGELQGGSSERLQEITRALSDANFDARPSESIVQELWEKWVFIASAAGLTTLMRAAVGDVVEAGGSELARALHAEAVTERVLGMPTAPGSPITASMLKDIERGSRIEAEQIIGDLIQRAPELEGRLPLLELVLLGLKSYEARRRREGAA